MRWHSKLDCLVYVVLHTDRDDSETYPARVFKCNDKAQEYRAELQKEMGEGFTVWTECVEITE